MHNRLPLASFAALALIGSLGEPIPYYGGGGSYRGGASGVARFKQRATKKRHRQNVKKNRRRG